MIVQENYLDKSMRRTIEDNASCVISYSVFSVGFLDLACRDFADSAISPPTGSPTNRWLWSLVYVWVAPICQAVYAQ